MVGVLSEKPWWGELEGKPIIIAHRCGCGEAPENTISAVLHSLNSGAKIVQLEVLPARDGTPMVAQSDDLQRLTGQDIKLSETMPNEIPSLVDNIPSYLPGMVKEINTTEYKAEGRQIPTLASVLKVFKETDVNEQAALFVEPFVFDEGFIARVAQDVNEAGVGQRVIVGHPFSAKIQSKIMEAFPDSEILLTLSQCLWLGILFRIGFLSRDRVPKNRVLNINYPSGTLTENVLKLFPIFSLIRYFFIITNFLLGFLVFRKNFVEFVQSEGCPISAFVVNDEKSWQELLRLGVRAIMTDIPKQGVDFLNRQ
eukprot:TRINITY_DN2234_c0_g1_i3.p1 TRINITY_DN2234_c0_g1~~TRINITY_DN2234_c0_g1_i3.p1  ORF type:complete len:311 (-),score=28.21 TRINITY_DN2234_c0_g1_i3:112-1044(-)